MLEKLKKGFEIVNGTAKKERAQQRMDEVSAAIRNCLGMEKEGNKSLEAYRKEREELCKIPVPYSEEGNRLWELKKIKFDSEMDQIAAIMKREIGFVRDSKNEGVLVSSQAIGKMERLREEFLSMKFSEPGDNIQFNSGKKIAR